MQKKQLKKTVIRFSFYLIFFIITRLVFETHTIAGLCLILSGIWNCFILIKCKRLMTPFLVGEILLICFGLYKIRLVSTMSEMDLLPTIVILSSIFLWQFICALNTYNYRVIDKLVFNLRPNILKICIHGLFLISTFFIAVEWIRAGGIPALQPSAETARFSVSFNAIWHIIAMAIKYVPMFTAFYLMAKDQISFRKDKGLIFVSTFSLLILIGTAQRGELLSAPVIIFLAFYCYKRPNIKKLIIPVIFMVVILAIYPIWRGYNAYGITYIYDIKSISIYKKFWFLTPIYQTFANSFHILNKDINTFPSLADFGVGKYTFLCNIPFVDLADSLAKVQNDLWNNNFYSELTPTFFGDWYADFGYIGCFIGIIIIAVFLNILYKNFIIKRDAMTLSLYSLNFYKSICMLYDNTFDFVWLTYMLLIWFVLKISKRRNRGEIINE